DLTISHMYYGSRISEYRNSKKFIYMDRGFSPNPEGEESNYSYDTLPQEYPTNGNGDFRIPAYQILDENGARVSNFKYWKHEIIKGKPKLEKLPSSYQTNNDNTETLIIYAKDSVNQLLIKMNYSI